MLGLFFIATGSVLLLASYATHSNAVCLCLQGRLNGAYAVHEVKRMLVIYLLVY